MPLGALRGCWRDAEEPGFDVLWNCDTVVDTDPPRHTMFDGPVTPTTEAETVPLPVQQPRPPVTMAATAPGCFASPPGVVMGGARGAAMTLSPRKPPAPSPPTAATAFDDLCVAADPGPASIRHSLGCSPPLTPWQSNNE